MTRHSITQIPPGKARGVFHALATAWPISDGGIGSAYFVMQRTTLLGFGLLSAVVLALAPFAPQATSMTGWRVDEPTTYLMALSLVRDGDLRCAGEDLARLADLDPPPQARLALRSGDGWRTLCFDRPLLYPLLAAPWVALGGLRGAVTLHALLFLLAVLLGFAVLRRAGPEHQALLLAMAFFLAGAAFLSIFRWQPHLLGMTALLASFTLLWTGGRASPGGEPRTARAAGSGVCLAMAAIVEPAVVIFALPLLARLGLRRAQRPAHAPARPMLAWLLGLGATLGLWLAMSHGLTGHPFPHRPQERAALSADEARSHARQASEPAALGPAAPPSQDAAMRRPGGEILEDAGLLLWGRHIGLLPYFPLALPIALLFLLRRRHDALHLSLLAAVAVFMLARWLAGSAAAAAQSSLPGNPDWLLIYPAFLFPLARLRPGRLSLALGALAMLLVWPLLTAPWLGHEPARRFPLSTLPLEVHLLGELPGFAPLALPASEEAVRLWLPAGETAQRDGTLRLTAGGRRELWLESARQMRSAVFEVRAHGRSSEVSIDFAGHRETARFERPAVQLRFAPRRPNKVLRSGTRARYFYRLRVAARPVRGEAPGELSLTYLGPAELLARELYAVEWQGCGTPEAVEPEESFLALARLINRSDHRWPARGAARVRLAYRWLDPSGAAVDHRAEPSDLAAPVAAGDPLAAWLRVRAPARPGRYLLEIDPLFDRVAFFSERGDGATCRSAVEVLPAAPPT